MKSLVNDPEMHEIASMELDEKHALLEKIKSELEILLLPKDENDGKDIIMEIRGAAGGDEANIFAGDLFRMYSRYAEKIIGRSKYLEKKKELVVDFHRLSF